VKLSFHPQKEASRSPPCASQGQSLQREKVKITDYQAKLSVVKKLKDPEIWVLRTVQNTGIDGENPRGLGRPFQIVEEMNR